MVNESRIFLQIDKRVADASFSEDEEEIEMFLVPFQPELPWKVCALFQSKIFQ